MSSGYVNANIIASSTQTLVGATGLSADCAVNLVTTVAGDGDGVRLPNCNSGTKISVINADTANYCNVYPPSADAYIDNLGAGIPYRLNFGACAEFVAFGFIGSTGTCYYTSSNEKASLVQPPIVGNGSSTSIGSTQTGTVFTVLDNSADTTITLPAVKAGLMYSFIGIAKATANKKVWRVDCGAGLLDGTVTDPAPQTLAKAGGQYINFIANTYVAGDRADVICTGTHWAVRAISGASGGITLT